MRSHGSKTVLIAGSLAIASTTAEITFAAWDQPKVLHNQGTIDFTRIPATVRVERVRLRDENNSQVASSDYPSTRGLRPHLASRADQPLQIKCKDTISPENLILRYWLPYMFKVSLLLTVSSNLEVSGDQVVFSISGNGTGVNTPVFLEWTWSDNSQTHLTYSQFLALSAVVTEGEAGGVEESTSGIDPSVLTTLSSKGSALGGSDAPLCLGCSPSSTENVPPPTLPGGSSATPQSSNSLTSISQTATTTSVGGSTVSGSTGSGISSSPTSLAAGDAHASSSSGGLSTGAIAGIAVAGAVVGLVLIGAAIWFLCFRRRQRKPKHAALAQKSGYTSDGLGGLADKEMPPHIMTESPNSAYAPNGGLRGVDSNNNNSAMYGHPTHQYQQQDPHDGVTTARSSMGPGAVGAAAGATTGLMEGAGHGDRDVAAAYAPYTDHSPPRIATGSEAMSSQTSLPAGGNRSPTPPISNRYAHLVEEGMTDDEIRRLEEEERALDMAIEDAGRTSRAHTTASRGS